jgi:predicted Zn finger-like uncharacterized protein
VLTQCPNCQTTFRVTSEILRVAHGQVRCGRCQTQFDAIERLVEEEAVSQSPSGRYPRASESAVRKASTIEVDEPASHEEITLEGRRIEISGTYEIPSGAGEDGEPQIRQEVVEEWVEIADDEPEATPDAESSSIPEYDLREAAEESAEIEEDAAEAEPTPPPPPPPPRPAAQPYRRRKTDTPAPDELELLAKPVVRSSAAKWWKYVLPPLAVLLVVQIVDYNSPKLATHPSIGPPLIGVYQKLHLPITPNWNLHAYKIEHWPIMSEPGSVGTLRVRANITNLAPFPQPYPLLRLVLADRFGTQVRARDFDPSEYLDGAVASERLMAPSQKADVTFTFVDPGQDADGFTFDACLRGRERTVCADEVPQ